MDNDRRDTEPLQEPAEGPREERRDTYDDPRQAVEPLEEPAEGAPEDVNEGG